MRLLGQFQAFFFFCFYEEILHTRKSRERHKKHKKHKTQKNDFHSHVLYAHKNHKKHKKAQNVKQAIFFFLDVFYVHKNTVFFALHTKIA